MSTTFGELTALAQDHLRYAAKYDLATASAAELVAATCALAAATARVADLIAEPPHRPRNTDPDPAWRLAGATVTEQVSRARELLALTTASLVPERTAFRHPTAAHLLAGRTALGASRDLLATHTELTASGPVDRTPDSSLIRSTEARHQLVSTAAHYAGFLAPVADCLATALGDDDQQGSAQLQTVAGHLAIAGASAYFARNHLPRRPDPLAALAAVAPLSQRPASRGETPQQLLDQALSYARRIKLIAFLDLGIPVPRRHRAETLALVASAMVTSHLTQSRLLSSIRTSSNSAHPSKAALDRTETRVRAGLAAWIQVRQEWAGMKGLPSTHNDAGVHLDASELNRSLRELATVFVTGCQGIEARNRARVHSTRTQATEPWLLEGLNRLQDLEQQIAADHAQLAEVLASTGRILVRTRTLDDDADVPRVWSPAPGHRAMGLSNAYRASLQPLASVHSQSRPDADIALPQIEIQSTPQPRACRRGVDQRGN